jgi:glycosyltransferase involved in cell wall biosynthesis
MDRRPKVSVAMISYNHAAYIDQAIASVIEQRVPFQIELVVGDDCSTDATSAKIKSWVDRHPDIIKPIFQPRNVGMFENFNTVLTACRGEFVASLEGDDYWTDPDKLRLQVEVMEARPDAAFCFHPLLRLEEKTGVFCDWSFPLEFRRPGLTARDMLSKFHVPANARMWRREHLAQLDHRMRNLRVLDIPMNAILAARGAVLFIDRVMGVYRLHSNGIWTGKTLLFQKRGIYEWMKCAQKVMPVEYRQYILGLTVTAHTEVIAEQRKISALKTYFSVPAFFWEVLHLPPSRWRPYFGWLAGMLLGR